MILDEIPFPLPELLSARKEAYSKKEIQVLP